jgi:uncharacterized protein YndB with AHSA1/START domain
MTAATDRLEPIEISVVVPLDRQGAFDLFARRIGDWWPAKLTWSGDALVSFEIEPRQGGHCVERGPFGFSLDWGRVTTWQPPERLAFTWQIGPDRTPQPDPERASEVEVTFVGADAARSTVSLDHRALERHGDGAEAYRAGMSGPQGWTFILDRYVAAANAEAG